MARNRVEELEATVAELQSTVQGLTAELVEAKERIRTLEDAVDAESPTHVPDRRVRESPDDDDAEAPKSDETETVDEAEDSGIDDIIVA